MTTVTWIGPRFVRPTGPMARSLTTHRRAGSGWIAGFDASHGEQRSLPSGWALPGFVDSHAHLDRLGMRPDGLWFGAEETEAEIAGRIQAAASARSADEWIVGRGWSAPCGIHPVRGPELPEKSALDQAAPNHPVCLKRADEHAIWVNSRALQLAGIGAHTRDPAGGHIVRDDRGEPTGVLVDAAMPLVKDLIPEVTLAQRRRILQEEMEKFLAAGVTCVHDMAVRQPLAVALESLAQDDELPLRVRAWLWAGDHRNRARMAGKADPPGPERLRFRGIKVFLDGALGSQGARLSIPYPDGRTGLQLDDDETIAHAIECAREGGWQLAAHAIGDEAVADAAQRLATGAPPGDHRWRIEHVQIAPPHVLQTMREAGIAAAIQPIHGAHDLPWAAGMLGELLADAYRWGSLTAHGLRVGMGTDHPIESIDPRQNLVAATTRRDSTGQPLPGQSERLSREQALYAYTVGSASLAFDEGRLGTLESGQLADFAVWDTDIRSCSPARLEDARCLAVVSDGKLVWTAD